MPFLGVDPGIRGGIAALNGSAVILAVDIPTIGEKAKQRVNVHELHALLVSASPIDHAFIERAQAMPKQGASSGFLYGRAVGAIETAIALAGIPLTIVEPSKWKKHFRLAGGDKERARQLALQLYPKASAMLSRKKDHGRAEAILIAQYGREMHAAMRAH